MGALTEAKKHKKKKTKEKEAPPAAAEQEPATPPDSGPPDNTDQEPDQDSGSEADEQPAAAADENEDPANSAGGAPGGAAVNPDQGAAGADEGQGNAQDNEGGGQTQGAAPAVPNPQAPGAGDTTTGGADTPTSGTLAQGAAAPPPGEGDTGGGETPGANTAAGPGSTTDLPQVPMSQALQEEYKRLNDALMQILYGMPGDVAAQHVLQGLLPQGPAKIKGAVVASVLLVKEIYLKIKPPNSIILPFTKDVVAHVMDMGQQVKGIQYSEQECTAILGATLEGVLRIFGVTKQQVQNLGQHIPHSMLMAHAQKYQQAHAFAKTAIDKNNASWHDDKMAPQQASGEAGPQSGAPVNATPQTQST